MKRQQRKSGGGEVGQLTSSHSHHIQTLQRPLDYRALGHLFTIYMERPCYIHVTLSRYFNTLRDPLSVLSREPRAKNSTHYLVPTYRLSTHIFTALRPIFSALGLSCLKLLSPLARRFWTTLRTYQSPPTELPPTFSPLFHTPLYRASTHGSPALPPTEFATTTVLSHIKTIGNFLNPFQVSTCKVVSKFDLKNSTSLMMSLFLSYVWSYAQ